MLIKPGLFSQTSHADQRRNEFDLKNDVIITNKVEVDYLFIGDSITARWELEAYFNNLGRVINRGIGGDNTHYIRMRYEADALQLEPKNIILLIGVNDTMFLGTEFIFIDKAYEDLKNRIIVNIKDLINRTIKTNINLYVCSILPTNMKNDKFLSERNLIIKEANEEIKKYCSNNNIKYVDYYSKLVGNDGLTLKSGYCDDGVHPNVNGYNLMYEVIRNTL